MMPQRKARITAVLSVIFSSVAITNCAAHSEEPRSAEAEDTKVAQEEQKARAAAAREETEDQMTARLESLDRRLRKVEPNVDDTEEDVFETAREQRRDVGNALALLVVTTDRNWPIAKQDLELRLAALETNLEQLEQ